MPGVPVVWEAQLEGSQFKAGPGQKCKTLSQKITMSKRAGNAAQVREHLFSKHEALNSSLGTNKIF
jgi:hypothetical protein